ncbi:terpene synthase family protein [Streptomyces sp. NPDC054840]
MALTAQWAVFICCVDDLVDRGGLGTVPGEVEEFTAPLREVLAGGGGPPPARRPAYARVLQELWAHTSAGMPAQWKERFTADYTDFLDATEEEVALRRDGVRLTVAQYVRLRRRTITLLPLLDVLERTGDAPMVECEQVGDRLGELRRAVADIAGWVNDLVSAADDTAVGQDNLVTTLARQESCCLAEARQRAAAMISERRSTFHTVATTLRTGREVPAPLRQDMRRYVDLTQTFLTATLRWLTATGRFASDAGPAPADALAPQHRPVGCCPTNAASRNAHTPTHAKRPG